MKKSYLFSFILATMMSVSTDVMARTPNVSVSDTTLVHGIDEVVVTGSNQATSRNLLPYTISIVNSRQLEASGKTQL